MEPTRRILFAVALSTVLFVLLTCGVGAISPSEWTVHARVLTQLSEAEVRSHVMDRARWEAVRGPANSWTEEGALRRGSWGHYDSVVLQLTEDSDGVSMVQNVGEVYVRGRFSVNDTGEQREVRFKLSGEVQGGPMARLVLRFDRARFADRAQAELDGLLAPPEPPGVARGRVLVDTPCSPGICSKLRILEPRALAGTDVRIESALTGEACVATPLAEPAVVVPCP